MLDFTWKAQRSSHCTQNTSIQNSLASVAKKKRNIIQAKVVFKLDHSSNPICSTAIQTVALVESAGRVWYENWKKHLEVGKNGVCIDLASKASMKQYPEIKWISTYLKWAREANTNSVSKSANSLLEESAQFPNCKTGFWKLLLIRFVHTGWIC